MPGLSKRKKNEWDRACDNPVDAFSLDQEPNFLQFQAIMKHIPSGVVVIENPDGRISYVNDKACELYGIDPTGTKMPFRSSEGGLFRLDGKSYKAEDLPANRALASGEAVYDEELSIKRPDGTRIIVSADAAPLYDKEGNIVAAVGIFNDITERKKLVENLKNRDNLFENIIEFSPNPIWISDKKGNVIRMNQAMRDSREVTDAEILGKFNLLKDSQIKDQGFLPLVKSVFEEAKVVRYTIDYKISKETHPRAQTEKNKTIEVTMSPVTDNQGKVHNVICQNRDVTAQKTAEKNLGENEKKYQSLVENSYDAILMTALDGSVTAANPAACGMFGWTEEEISKGGRPPIMDSADPRLSQALEMMKHTGEFRGELDFIRRDGSRFSGELTSKVFTDWEGNSRTSMIIRDNSELKLKIEELKQTQEKSRTIFEVIRDSITIVDYRGNIIDCNEATLKLYGFDRKEELIGHNIIERIAPSSRETSKNNVKRNLKGELLDVLEYKLLKKNGREFDGEIKGSNVRNSSNGVEFSVAVVTDITWRKQAERDLKASETRFRQFFENEPSYCYMISPEGLILDINKAVLKATGYEKNELIGKSIMILYAPESLSRHKKLFTRWEELGVVTDEEDTILTKSGKRRTVLHSVDVVRDETGKIVHSISVMKDITDQKLSMVKLMESLKSTIKAIGSITEVSDPYTWGHQQRVTKLASAIAVEMGLSQSTIDGLSLACAVHDIGKIYVPAEIKIKPGNLNKLEFEIMKTHAIVGYDILKNIEFPWPIARIVSQHHERENGSGYPASLTGDKILIEAKILGVADTVEAMSSHRPYRPAKGLETAIKEIIDQRGILYDPEVVDTCVKLFKETDFNFV
jgi:PAS domain S-box-containing protein/putative nucleotidyltransferase with HDIG domain